MNRIDSTEPIEASYERAARRRQLRIAVVDAVTCVCILGAVLFAAPWLGIAILAQDAAS